tara:strand:+ start:92 stop:286 length:195 start_codon:yes stop_codon:yes gene_type:complete
MKLNKIDPIIPASILVGWLLSGRKKEDMTNQEEKEFERQVKESLKRTKKSALGKLLKYTMSERE